MFFYLNHMSSLYFADSLQNIFFILKGDYDVVINDYEKAKSLFGKTEVQVFRKCKACYCFSIFSFPFTERMWDVFCKECFIDMVIFLNVKLLPQK